MLDKFKEQLKKEAAGILKTATPKHIAITMDGISEWAKKNDKQLEDAYKESFIILKSTIKSQVRTNTPVLTLYLLPDNIKKDSEEFSKLINNIEEFFNEIVSSELITKNKIKISVLGKWYQAKQLRQLKKHLMQQRIMIVTSLISVLIMMARRKSLMPANYSQCR